MVAGDHFVTGTSLILECLEWSSSKAMSLGSEEHTLFIAASALLLMGPSREEAHEGSGSLVAELLCSCGVCVHTCEVGIHYLCLRTSAKH